MKRLSLKRKKRQLRTSFLRRMHRLARAKKVSKIPEKQFVAPKAFIKAPARFDLQGATGKEVVKFLRAVSHRVLKDKQPVRLNFKETIQFYVPGTILLFAELDRIIASADMPKPVSIVYPRLLRSREVMAQIGLNALVGDNANLTPMREDVIHWRATKGLNQTGDGPGNFVITAAAKLEQEYSVHPSAKVLWRGVSEAIANTTEHAYNFPRFDDFEGLAQTKWWMFTQIREGTLTVAVCDLGCGYRKTIGQTVPEGIRNIVKTLLTDANQDSLAIEAAMEFGRSGTKQSNRGKGSRDVKGLVEDHGSGTVTVISNGGWMKYSFAEKKEIEKKYGSLGIDCGGTIVWWNLPLMESENA